MKKKVIVCACAILFIIFASCFSLDAKHSNENDVYRLHIRANSNSSLDQYIKYVVKDKIVELVYPILSTISNIDDAKKFINKSSTVIESYANYILAQNKCPYKATTSIGENYFETKEIDGKVFKGGIYQSIIISLGSGTGNNWWGLIYPNFSFIGTNTNNQEGITYKSKLVEIWHSMKK